jgi:hypothetical protein
MFLAQVSPSYQIQETSGKRQSSAIAHTSWSFTKGKAPE